MRCSTPPTRSGSASMRGSSRRSTNLRPQRLRAPAADHDPLTGWFGCAGERGTGVAVLLDLVERFADRPLLVLATGGHELDYLGVRQWVAARRAEHGERPVAVIHVVRRRRRRTGRRRQPAPDPDPTRHDRCRRWIAERIGAALNRRRSLRPEPSHGSASRRCSATSRCRCCPSPAAVLRSTPEDTTARVTGAASLALVADAVARRRRCSMGSEISRPDRSGRCRRRRRSPTLVGVRNEGRGPGVRSTAHVVVRVTETAGRPLRDDAVLGWSWLELSDHAAHAALRVVEQDDLGYRAPGKDTASG